MYLELAVLLITRYKCDHFEINLPYRYNVLTNTCNIRRMEECTFRETAGRTPDYTSKLYRQRQQIKY